MNTELWYHGTPVHFSKWRVGLGPQPHKGGFDSHNAIFLTTSRAFALGAAEGTGGLCTTRLKSSATVLDMTNCGPAESERFRLQVARKRISSKSLQVLHRDAWIAGWKSGRIMKYAPSEDERKILAPRIHLATHARHTPEGNAAFNEIQKLTRDLIEELVTSARELGHEGVIGNEIDTLHPSGSQTYKTMFVLNPEIIENPRWLSMPAY